MVLKKIGCKALTLSHNSSDLHIVVLSYNCIGYLKFKFCLSIIPYTIPMKVQKAS